jgi:hypothetical protein
MGDQIGLRVRQWQFVGTPEKSHMNFYMKVSIMNPERHAAACFGLLDDLEGLFGRRVDLVEIEAVRNPYLRRGIEERKQILVGCRDCGQPEGVGV